MKENRDPILSDSELERRLHDKDVIDEQNLIIVPLLNTKIKGGSIDIRLGTKFLLTKRVQRLSIDPVKLSMAENIEVTKTFLERINIPIDGQFILHPGQLILAITLEYICLPKDLSAQIITRSSYGRVGLITATASYIHPGFKGCPTLEIYNYGDTPIILCPGLQIAQVVFHYHLADLDYLPSRYSLSTEPEFPEFWEDEDLLVLAEIHKIKQEKQLLPIQHYSFL